MNELETLEKKIEARCQELDRKIKTKSGGLVLYDTSQLREEIAKLVGRAEGLREALELVTQKRADNPLLLTNPPGACL